MRGEDFKGAKETVTSNAFTGFLKAVTVSTGFTLVLFAIFSLVIAYTPVSDGSIPALSLFVMVLSVCICSCIATRGAKSKGYLKGAFSGIVYVFIIYLISTLVGGEMYFNAYLFVLLAVGVFAGAFGGILGINLGVKNRR